MFSRTIRRHLSLIRRTPLHPQWLIFLNEDSERKQIAERARGTVLDIGCGDQSIRAYLTHVDHYIGLDHYVTATQWYGTRPQVFADAQLLPFLTGFFDTVLMLDVLEHLPRPANAMSETARILKPGGLLILSVPFLYPLHDEPLDFHRWTRHGLDQMADQYGLRVIESRSVGQPLETAGLLLNLALAKTLLDWMDRRHPAVILGVLVPLLVLLTNLLCWLLARLSPFDEMMPYGYRYLFEKTA